MNLKAILIAGFLSMDVVCLTGCPDAELNGVKGTPDLQCTAEANGALSDCASFDFGDVPVGSVATQKFALTNTGRGTLTITTSGWNTGSDAAFTDAFTIRSVTALGHDEFSITFHPTRAGSASGTFFVTSPNGTKTKVQLVVTGTGAGWAAPKTSTSSVNFGNVLQNTTASSTVMLSNTGSVPLTVASATTTSGVFGVQGPSGAVAAGASTPVTVTYSPTGPEQDSGSAHLTFATSAASSTVSPESLTISLTGESEPQLTVTPPSVVFGDVTPSVNQQMVTLTNTGKATLDLTSVALTVNSSAYFSEVPTTTLSPTLAPDAGEQLTVTYDTVSKTDMTDDTGTIEIISSDPVNPTIDVPLSGGCPTCQAIDSGCDATYPHRLWPSMADISSCSEGGPTLNTTGPGAEDWLDYAGCGAQRDFTTVAGTQIEIKSWGDGCDCGGCVLWHIDYDIEENTGGGFVTEQSVVVSDANQCPNNMNVSNTTDYTPVTTDVRMVSQFETSGEGYYFTVCSQ